MTNLNKRTMKRSAFLLAFLCGLMLAGCRQEAQQPYAVIDLKREIRNDGLPGLTLNDLADVVGVIPTETSDSLLLRFLSINDALDDQLVICDSEGLYFIDRKNGDMTFRLKRLGRGPGEYSVIDHVTVSPDTRDIFLFDPMQRRTNIYSFDGQYAGALSGDTIGKIAILSDGNYAVNYPPFSPIQPYGIGIYDKTWKLIRRGIAKSYDPNSLSMLFFDALGKYNDDIYYRPALTDTIYRVTSAGDEPAIVIRKGNYAMPIDLARDRETMDREGVKYITQDSGPLASKYLFLSFWYNQALYHDIWDIETSNLIFRSKYSRTGGINGIPLTIDGKEIVVWPSKAIGNSLFCTLNATEAAQLLPSIKENDNPVIIELKIKEQ